MADCDLTATRSPGRVASHHAPAARLGDQQVAVRLAADQQLVAALAEQGFAGQRYERFRDELARYGMAVLC